MRPGSAREQARITRSVKAGSGAVTNWRVDEQARAKSLVTIQSEIELVQEITSSLEKPLEKLIERAYSKLDDPAD